MALDLQQVELEGLRFLVRNHSYDIGILHEVISADFYCVRDIRKAWENVETIFDIGAHIGAFSKFCKSLWPAASVVAFEPSPENLPLLRLNTEGLDGIEIVPMAAIGDGRAQVPFMTHLARAAVDKDAIAENSGGGRVQDGVGAIGVNATQVLSFIQRYGKVDLLKFDCEGAEGDILLDIQRSGLASKIGWIRGEWHNRSTIYKIVKGLQPTHAYQIRDPGGTNWDAHGFFIAHRIGK